ncbi:alpha-glucan family phosphorylase [Candidatus Fermentibacteria bacterium]|nr:alpha-glucan family phosphorylase [Candidatus Fermentibacteria bacterium]
MPRPEGGCIVLSKKIQLFNVAPALPSELEFLETLSHNLWWCWNPDAIELFRRINPRLWKEKDHNPFTFFCEIPQERFQALLEDDGFMSRMARVRERFEKEVSDAGEKDRSDPERATIAYFSLEYGIHESLRIYSGGLGCLAGDHLKSSSDLDLPLVAVGLLYRCGRFHQYLDEEGWQQESWLENEVHHLPLRKVTNDRNSQIYVSIPLPEGRLMAAVWRADMGRVPLLLLDPNTTENPPELRSVGSYLYDSDREVRLRQEFLLGFGGFKALLRMGFDPPVCHMNEGHAAFAALARISHLVKDRGLDTRTAAEIVGRTSVFTTHTPVPAGNETFSSEVVGKHLKAMRDETGLDPSEVISWGRSPGNDSENGELNMTVLALRLSHFANGVSDLHGSTTRSMWSHLWPDRPEDEIPISHVTNGIHAASWVLSDIGDLLDSYLSPEWRTKQLDEDGMSQISQIPDEELWRAHETGRSRLVRTARELAERQYSARHATKAQIEEIRGVLNHDALTVGFARRFVEYKRAHLVLKNPQRLESILSNEDRPIQMIFAGKAHPADETGKSIIRELVRFAQRPGMRQRMVFLEDYDIQMARYLVQGVDVWLNTPRRPMEASGTSGMKAAINGALNLSILDGWWAEAYDPDCGWVIGKGEEYDNTEYQDAVESNALYNLLEDEVIPCFYDRSESSIPLNWVRMMKSSIETAFSYFTTHRMVGEYDRLMYRPALEAHGELWENDAAKAQRLVQQAERLRSHWDGIGMGVPRTDRDISALHVGDRFTVEAVVRLGELTPEEVDVEAYYGPVNSESKIVRTNVQKMQMVEETPDGGLIYRQEVECRETGRFGLTARVVPSGDEWRRLIPGFITWADGQ